MDRKPKTLNEEMTELETEINWSISKAELRIEIVVSGQNILVLLFKNENDSGFKKFSKSNQSDVYNYLRGFKEAVKLIK